MEHKTDKCPLIFKMNYQIPKILEQLVIAVQKSISTDKGQSGLPFRILNFLLAGFNLLHDHCNFNKMIWEITDIFALKRILRPQRHIEIFPKDYEKNFVE